MPGWISIATGLGGLVVGALFQYMRDRRILARHEAFTHNLVKWQEQANRAMAEWRQECQQAMASIGSVRHPGGREIPPLPTLKEFEPPSSRWHPMKHCVFRRFRKANND
jgi:hypothetical protein